MTRHSLLRNLLLTFLALIVAVSCRRNSPDPNDPVVSPTTEITAAPDATSTLVPTELPDDEPTSIPTTSPTSEPTAIPQTELSFDWEPEVVYSSPQLGEQTALDGAITVRFDQPMDQASVEQAFDVGDVSGEFMWTRDDTVVFTPEMSLTRATTYTVQIADSARSLNGKNLRVPFAQQFQTVGNLAVSQVIPADQTDAIAADSAITVLFNRPVVPLAGTMQQADLPNPITISPAVEGTGEWVGTSIFRFTPTVLDGATTYEVTVNAGLEDVAGGVLTDDFTTVFTTVPPQVVETTLPQSEPDQEEFGFGNDSLSEIYLNPTQTFTITFNMPMDRVSTEAAISVDDTPLTFRWTDEDRSVAVTPDLALATEYTLTVDDSAASVSGTTFEETYTAVFETYPFPAVEQTYPGAGEVLQAYSVASGNGINITFVSPMDWETIEEQLIIEPTPERLRYVTNSERNVYVGFELDYLTEYNVTIPATASDIFGNQLGEAYTWSFSTPAPLPVFAFNLPAPFAQISANQPSDIALLYQTGESAETTITLSRFDEGVPLSLFGQSYFDPNRALPAMTTLDTFENSVNEGAGANTLSLNGGSALPTGVYHLDLDAPTGDEDVRFWQTRETILIVADTNIVIKETPNFIHVWTTDLATGDPAPNRDVTVYLTEDDAITGELSGTTDADGLLTLERPNSEQWFGYRGRSFAVTGEAGEPNFGVAIANWNQSARIYEMGISPQEEGGADDGVYLYTERPLYRPGDTVYFKGWLRDSNYARYTLPEPRTIELRFFPPNYEDTIEPIEIDVLPNGSFDGKWVIPDDAMLGTYQFFVETGGRMVGQSSTSFMVAEFRKPEFTLEVTPNISETLRGETVEFTVSAEYLFGGNASDLPVDYNIYTSSYIFPYDGRPYYSFGEVGNFFYFDPFIGFGSNFYLNGSGVLDGNGNLTIEVTPEMMATMAEGSQKLIIDVTVRDLSENFISAHAEVVLHSAETYVGIRGQEYAFPRDEVATVELHTVDWEQTPVPNQSVEIVFSRREWISEESVFGGGLQWRPEDTEVARQSTTTDSDGMATASFTPEEGGTYLASATVSDAAGRTQTSETLFYVFAGDVAWRSDSRDRSMNLEPDAEMYQVGETAQILIQNPLGGGISAWLTIERGDVLEQRLITLEGTSDILEIPIEAIHAPNVYVSVTAIKGADDGDTRFADIRLGITELRVDPERLALNVEITSDLVQAEPRDTVTFEVKTTNYLGEGVSADVALALVDLAILTLKEDTNPALIDSLYSPESFRSSIGSGLFVTGEGLDINIPEPFFGGGGGGGGGGVETAADLTLEREAQTDADGEIRDDFRDTAAWEANVTTDENGVATIDVTLPDNLTTWRMTGRAVSDETLVGESTHDIVATKFVLIRPVTPRFLTFGDLTQLGAIVNNNTEADVEADVSLEVDGVTLTGDALQTVNVPAGGSTLVRWEATVEDVAAVDLIFRVNAGEYSDASRPTIGARDDNKLPVYRFNAEDFNATAGVLDQDETRRVEAVLLPPLLDATRGDLTISMSPSLGAALFESLDAYMFEGATIDQCPIGAALRLLPNAASLSAIQDLQLAQPALAAQLEAAIADQVTLLTETQNDDGGWSFCRNGESDAQMTAFVLHALLEAQPESAVIAAGIEFLQDAVDELSAENRADANTLAYYLYVISLSGEDISAELVTLLEDGRDLLTPASKAFALMAQHNASGDVNDNLISDLANSVVLNATGAHWESEFRNWIGGDITDTAIVIEALTQVEPENGLLPNAIRWLMGARDHRYWNSQMETAFSISAVANYMVANGETDAQDTDFSVAVNSGQAAQGEDQVVIPLADLSTDELNYLDFRKGSDGRLYYAATLDAFVSADSVEAIDRGFNVVRTYYNADCEEDCEPLTTIAAGEAVRVELTIIVPNNRRFVQISDPLPAGADAIDPNLDTSPLDATAGQQPDGDRFSWWGWWYFSRIEFRDEAVVFFADYLPAGTYRYSYELQPIVPGTYQVMPTVAKESLQEEVFGRSDGQIFTIVE